MLRIQTGLIALILVALLGACEGNRARKAEQQRLSQIEAEPIAQDVRRSQRDWRWVVQNTWELVEIEGRSPIAGTESTIRFEEHTLLNGSAGCNRYFGSYERVGTSGLDMHDIGATRMFCREPEGVMQQESRFLFLLAEVNSYIATDRMLELSNDEQPVLRFLIADD